MGEDGLWLAMVIVGCLGRDRNGGKLHGPWAKIDTLDNASRQEIGASMCQAVEVLKPLLTKRMFIMSTRQSFWSVGGDAWFFNHGRSVPWIFMNEPRYCASFIRRRALRHSVGNEEQM